MSDKHGKNDREHVEVAVLTTSGTYPPAAEHRPQEQVYATVPIHQKVEEVLKKAASQLRITNTSGWVARVGTREIVPEESFLKNELSGRVDIDWGPREGGGGVR